MMVECSVECSAFAGAAQERAHVELEREQPALVQTGEEEHDGKRVAHCYRARDLSTTILDSRSINQRSKQSNLIMGDQILSLNVYILGIVDDCCADCTRLGWWPAFCIATPNVPPSYFCHHDGLPSFVPIKVIFVILRQNDHFETLALTF